MLTLPLYMMQVFDRVLSSRSTDTLLALAGIAILALLTMAALEAIRGWLLVRIGIRLEHRASASILAAGVDNRLFDAREPAAQGLHDLNAVRNVVAGPALIPVMDAPWTPVFVIATFVLHPLLGWLTLAGALALLALALANEVATRRLLTRARETAIEALADADAAVRGADTVRAMGMLPGLVRRWRQYSREIAPLQSRAGHRSALISAISRFLRASLQIGVLSVGAWLVLENQLSAGGMVAGSILLTRALAPVERAIATWRSIVNARSAYRRIESLFQRAGTRNATVPLVPPAGYLVADGVTFAHPGTKRPCVRNVSFSVAPGHSLAVIGPTAAGKTTLARLLVGNLAPGSGRVRLDGIDLAGWAPDDLGRHLGYLPQDVQLFRGTIGENIARMGPADPRALVEAGQLAGVHEMVLELPKGYDTEVGHGGAGLSGGQRQRIALARALYGSPKLVVLDEPNANLDGEGEDALVQAILALTRKGTTVDRPRLLEQVDSILVLREGAIAVCGSRQEVVARLRRNFQRRPAPVTAETGVEVIAPRETSSEA
jgi:ATP-binding cassette subfamily B protein/ATP-binding cassette subfamily C protein